MRDQSELQAQIQWPEKVSQDTYGRSYARTELCIDLQVAQRAVATLQGAGVAFGVVRALERNLAFLRLNP